MRWSPAENFLNYDITWNDAERVFAELAADQLIARRVSEFICRTQEPCCHLAREELLKHKVYPASRPELPAQLRQIGAHEAADCLQRLIDPTVPDTRSLPRTEQDLAIAAQRNWLLVFENLSYISPLRRAASLSANFPSSFRGASRCGMTCTCHLI